jgi:hypothetical protein
VLAIFQKMRIENEEVRDWVRAVLQSQTKDFLADSLAQRAEIQRQMTLAVQQQNRIVDMRINQEIDADIFAGKQTELRDRLAGLKLQLDVIDRSHDEMCDQAVKVTERSQALAQKWVTADYATKVRILKIVFLNCRLDDVTLVPTIRKPFVVRRSPKGFLCKCSPKAWKFVRNPCKTQFPHTFGEYLLDVLAEGLLVSSRRGDRTSIELFFGLFREWEKSLLAMAPALAN